MRKEDRIGRLWAPWRMAYLRQSPDTPCFLCACARRRADRRHLVLCRGKKCFVTLNLYPYNNGHLLIAPLAHKGRLAALTAEERAGLFELLVEMQALLDRAMKPHGYNIGINLGRAAGAGVPGHLHLHLVPRWKGDTNFMPVTGRTKVISQSLADLHEQLQKARRKGR